MSNIFGDYLKRLRLEKKQSLRSFCDSNCFDPGNYSKVERGILPPPRDKQKMEPYRLALGLDATSAEWLELERLASISRGEIPAKLLNDADILQKLPALFRTLEGENISPEELNELIAALRGQ